VLGFVYSKGTVSIKAFVGGAGGEACSQAAAFLSPAAGAGGDDWWGGARQRDWEQLSTRQLSLTNNGRYKQETDGIPVSTF
jgi:hypothetical protein